MVSAVRPGPFWHLSILGWVQNTIPFGDRGKMPCVFHFPPWRGKPSTSMEMFLIRGRGSTRQICLDHFIPTALEMTHPQIHQKLMLSIPTAWWLTYPSEKYKSQREGLSHILWKIKNVPNHQPANYWSKKICCNGWMESIPACSFLKLLRSVIASQGCLLQFFGNDLAFVKTSKNGGWSTIENGMGDLTPIIIAIL